METFTSLTPQQLRRAANVKEKIDALQHELNYLLGVTVPATVGAVGPIRRKRKKISSAGIERIRAAQQARWAAFRRTHPAKAKAKSKRKFSAAGRARLAALARARWAKAKASGKSRL